MIDLSCRRLRQGWVEASGPEPCFQNKLTPEYASDSALLSSLVMRDSKDWDTSVIRLLVSLDLEVALRGVTCR